jgi:hypothetical protein
MQDFEKLGAFYLGRELDAKSTTADGKMAPTGDLLMYDSKDLVTHAVCVGMTGSGKTGLCIALLEEAAIDGIPAIIVDPKGDLANLLLTFPDLRGEDFRPWINEGDAAKAGATPEAYAQQQAELWKKGLAGWGQDGARIRRLMDSCERTVYTPGSSAGVQVSILRSFDCPPAAVLEDAELLRERVASTVTGLLSLAGVKGDPVQSREHILLCNILYMAWASGESPDLATLIQRVQQPPFTRIGVLELEAFFPSKDRFALAMAVNNLLASPQMQAWTQGEALDVGRMLSGAGGKPRLAVISIAHLGDAERMFFVSLLLNQVLGWVRSQSGTSSLRAIFYMDEIAGYVPPTANPPSKGPLLTLMKQGRAFGLGVVLATQNPVDIDYKGLSNAGTWLIGRLQTEQDKARVLDGLEGASAAASARFDRAEMDRLLSRLGKRVFLMNNVHDSGATVFETRWCLSYLRGPLTREQIRGLTAGAGAGARPAPGGRAAMAFMPPGMEAAAAAPATAVSAMGGGGGAGARPVLPPQVVQRFMRVEGAPGPGQRLEYAPGVLGFARTYFADSKLGLDVEVPVAFLTMAGAGLVAVDWEKAQQVEVGEDELDVQPAGSARFGELPAECGQVKSYEGWKKGFAEAVFRAGKIELLRHAGLKLVSAPGEDEGAFRARVGVALREQRDAQLEKLRAKYGPKIAALQEKMRKAEQKIEVQAQQAGRAKMDTAISIGSAVLGAVLGRKALSTGTMSKAATAARSVGRAGEQAGDVARAQEDLASVRAQMGELEAQFKAEAGAVLGGDASAAELERVVVRPKKAGVSVRAVVLVWVPRFVDG